MKTWMVVGAILSFIFFPFCLAAADQADDLWILAAGRGPGAAGSMWFTDLNIMNVSEEDVEVEVSFIPRASNQAVKKRFDLAAANTLNLPDVLNKTFGLQTAYGAIRVEVVAEDDEEDVGMDHPTLVAEARVYDKQSSGTMGQGLGGLSSAAATSADGDVLTTHVVGVTDNAAFRSNWFALNVAEPEEDEEEDVAEVEIEILDARGETIASKTYNLEPLTPTFTPISDIATGFENATVRFTMIQGRALFGVSKIDMLTNDPTTLEASVPAQDPLDKQYTDTFLSADCTFSPNGNNPFFPLTPGLKLVLKGEDDGEVVQNTIEILNETAVVNGVTTRVLTETELHDGELVEISRNFYAQCVETGDVFYFGEEVDIYDEGKLVSHAGAWRAGEDGAEAGIIMPGKPLSGSRYYQEIAPEVALDRAEHLKTGFSFETAAGEFTNCLSVRETTPLEPGQSSFKIYCSGVGLVVDSGSELASRSRP